MNNLKSAILAAMLVGSVVVPTGAFAVPASKDTQGPVWRELWNAAYYDDGMQTSRILKREGSCRWAFIIRMTSFEAGPFKLGTHSVLAGDIETVTLYKITAGTQVPLATVSDTVCEKKSGEAK